MGTFVRFGFIVRGMLYLLTGIYGLLAAIGLQGSTKDTLEIVKTIGSIPFGNIALVATFVGLVGYGSWGLIRAIIGPLDKGSRAKGLITRIGYLTSGLSYLVLSIIPIHLLLNMATVDSSSSKSSALLLFHLPGGLLLVTIIGLIIIAGGISQIYYGYQENFKKSLQTMKSKRQEKILMTAGKIGYVARGIVFSLIGIFFLKAGLTGNAIQAKDPGEILIWTWQQIGGSILLGIISTGLIALGIYSIIASKAVKLKAYEKS